MLYRLLLAEWKKTPDWKPHELPTVIEDEMTEDEMKSYNNKGYNCYTILNNSSTFEPGRKKEDGKPLYIAGSDIDIFNYVFVDMDLKDATWESKESFISFINASTISPTAIVDSGNGVHVYWRVVDLDAMSFLRLMRRLARFYKTDDKVCTIYRIMRVPGSFNVKDQNNFKLCEVLESNEEVQYTCEDLDKALPKITTADEEYCQKHYDQTYHINDSNIKINDELPIKFQSLMKMNSEVKKLFFGPVPDRSSADYRLAHLMLAQAFTKDEGMSVLLNTAKAISRTNIHRYNYANNIINKVWAFEDKVTDTSKEVKISLSKSVSEILKRDSSDRRQRIYGHPIFDAHNKGFRLGEVFGLIGGTGIGKTTLCLNKFKWFVERNPDFIHVFASLEEPEENIADTWNLISQGNQILHDKVRIIGNRDENGTTRRLSLWDIQDEIFRIEKDSGQKVGCVVIDHIGVIKPVDKQGKNIDLLQVCADMGALAQTTNTFVIMLSQTSRAKAGIGDIELDKDAAFGTVMFESYCDYVMTIWQPLKRVYKLAPHMTINSFKYCKIRPKTVGKDLIYEDQVYAMILDPETRCLRDLNEAEYEAYDYFNKQAIALRNQDKKRNMATLTQIDWNIDDSATKHTKD